MSPSSQGTIMVRIYVLLLVGGICQAADVDRSPKRERPVPANKTMPINIKVKHRDGKKKPALVAVANQTVRRLF